MLDDLWVLLFVPERFVFLFLLPGGLPGPLLLCAMFTSFNLTCNQNVSEYCYCNKPHIDRKSEEMLVGYDTDHRLDRYDT